MAKGSENIKALMTFVGLTIVLTTIGIIIMDKKFEEDQKEFEDKWNYQTDQTIKVWDSLLKRKKSNYEKIYEEFLENRRKMINGEL